MDMPHIVEVPRYEDERGWFEPWFLQTALNGFQAKQVNFNLTKKNAFRGFHFGVGEVAQAKYVSCLRGSVLDFVVDIRKTSKDFGRVYRFELFGDSPTAVFIPTGFAHGIYGVSDESLMVYAASQEWVPNIEFTITPFDSSLDLGLDLDLLICTDKDRGGLLLNQYLRMV
jgi:dTDP-4-dehydrorhamnose 3,5-epimerase